MGFGNLKKSFCELREKNGYIKIGKGFRKEFDVALRKE